MAASRTPARRRQRSVRLTVALVLLSVATVGVLLALPTQSPVLLSASSVLALSLGWASLRIMWTEVLQSRRENAADRAAAASAYKSLFSLRAAEHAEFTTAMTERLAESNLSVRELQGELVLAQRQVADAVVRAESAERSLDDARDRVGELEQSIEMLRAEREAEEADALALWEAEGGPEFGTQSARGSVDELVTWEAKAAEIQAEQDEIKRAVKGA
ncbi:chromosome segregation ATPase [Marmoricola sp. URHA0025 HA25]